MPKWSVIFCIPAEYGPEKTPYLDNFHAVPICFDTDTIIAYKVIIIQAIFQIIMQVAFPFFMFQ